MPLSRRQLQLLGFVAVGLLAATALVEWPTETYTRLVDVLAMAGVALAALAGGWIAGAAALLVTSLILVAHPDHLAGEFTEWLVVVVVMLFVRRTVLRLHRSESKLRALVSSIDDLLFVLDENGTYVEVVATKRSPRYRPEKQVVGARVHEIFPPDFAGWIVATIRRALAAKETVEVDYSLTIDKNELWFNASVSPLSESTVIWVARDITTRKMAEVELERRVEERTAELRTSEERYRSVFDQAEEIIYTLSFEGLFTSLNPAFERILGWPCEEWIGRPFMALIPAECQETAKGLFDELRRDGSIPMSRLVLLGKDGQRVALELTVVDQVIGGRSIGFLGVARDITGREEAEEKMRRSERQLAEAQRSAGLGSYEHDLIAGTMLWSEELFRILGVPPTEAPLPFSTLADLVVEEDRAKLEEVQRTLLARGHEEWEMRVRLHDSIEKVLWCTGTVTSNPAQRILRVVGALKDITERKRAEQLLRESEERFRLIADATNDVIWDWDIVAGTMWRSSAFEKAYGYPAVESSATIELLTDRVHPDDRQACETKLREALGSGEMICSMEYRLRRTDGTYAHVLDRGYIVRDAQKKPVRMVGAMMDLTERKQLEDQLEQAKRVSSLGRVAASIAHEFNNVLMGIQPNVEVIQRSSPKGLRSVTDNILHAVRRGKRITDEILRFTRPAEPELQCLALSDFFERWKGEVEPLLGADVDLRIEAGSDLHVLADPLQLAQVFTNLAINARDAMLGRRGTLRVSAHLSKSFGSFPFGVIKSADRFVHFSVNDEGCGIARERLEHIFEPLFTTKAGGIGLGLAIAYQIVTRHEGHIFVESEPGAGSTFHLFIPATSPILHEAAPEAARQQLSLRRVLLVEDESAVASGIAMLLETEGIEVAIASTGAESIPLIESFAPDAVVLDIGLPDMDGVGVYLEVERRWPALPVLFSTGHGDSAKLQEYLARPNVGFILKPYEFDAMRAELNRLTNTRIS